MKEIINAWQNGLVVLSLILWLIILGSILYLSLKWTLVLIWVFLTFNLLLGGFNAYKHN
jgi:hypothetical protein